MSDIRRSGADTLKLLEIAADPAAVGDAVLLYGKDSGGVTHLYARLSSGAVYKLTPTISFLDEGIQVPNPPHDELNFTGPGVTASDAGGRVNVSIPGGLLPPSIGTEYFDDFLGGEMSVFGAAGGATNVFGAQLGANRPGTSTVTVSAAGVDSHRISTGGNNITGIYFSGGPVTIEVAHHIVTLSDGVNNTVVRDGAGDSVSTDYADGVYIEYDFATHGDHNYRLCAANNSVRTKVDTGIAAVAGATRRIVLNVNALGTLLTATIDGVASAGSIAANIPVTSARLTQISLQTVKQLGAAARQVIRDYYLFRQIFTTPR